MERENSSAESMLSLQEVSGGVHSARLCVMCQQLTRERERESLSCNTTRQQSESAFKRSVQRSTPFFFSRRRARPNKKRRISLFCLCCKFDVVSDVEGAKVTVTHSDFTLLKHRYAAGAGQPVPETCGLQQHLTLLAMPYPQVTTPFKHLRSTC